MASPSRVQAPKPPRTETPDGVSTTGSRPAGAGVERPAQTPGPPLETFEQTPQRGTEDARLMQRGAQNEPAGRAAPEDFDGAAPRGEDEP